MNDEELKKIWKSGTDDESALIQKSRMVNEVQLDIKSWNTMLKHGDSKKGVLIIILIGCTIIFGMIAYTKPDIQSKAGAILCILLFWYVIIRMIGAKKLYERNFSETYIDYLSKIRHQLKSIKNLYDIMLYVFYPIVATAALLLNADSIMTIDGVLLKLLFVIGFGISLYFLKGWALKKFILGKLNRIEKLIKELEE